MEGNMPSQNLSFSETITKWIDEVNLALALPPVSSSSSLHEFIVVQQKEPESEGSLFSSSAYSERWFDASKHNFTTTQEAHQKVQVEACRKETKKRDDSENKRKPKAEDEKDKGEEKSKAVAEGQVNGESTKHVEEDIESSDKA